MLRNILKLTFLCFFLLLSPNRSAAEAKVPATGTLCWYHPKNASADDKLRLTAAMNEAMSQTKPAHVDYRLERIKSKAQVPTLGCLAVIDVTKSSEYSRTKEISFRVDRSESDVAFLAQTLVIDLRKVAAAELTGLWLEIWRKVAPPAPPPPPPPAPPPVAETPYVDEELKEAQAAEAEAEKEAPLGRFLSLSLGFGVLARSLGGSAPGRPIDQGGAFSIGADALLHGAELLRLADQHDLDVAVAYAFRFLDAPDEDAVGVGADRFNFGAAYRYQLPGAYMPRVGGLAGYELLRNELSQSAGAYSVRYSVLRAGLTVTEFVPINERLSLRAFLDFALRLAPGAEGADTSPSFDLGGGVAMHFDQFFGRLRLRHALQSVGANDVSFSDGFFDFDLGLGFQL